MQLNNTTRTLSIVLIFILTAVLGFSQTISPRYFSQNAWMPDTIGNAGACIQPPCILYGQLHNKWNKIGESGANTVRFGGIQVDRNMPTNYQYIKMIDSIRAKGMEPIIQVPFYNWRYSAAQAAQIVQYINVTKGKNIKYWIIGNEPDHVYGYTTASQVASYIKPFASAMKAVDPSILIIGPETAWFNSGIINGLTNAGGPDDITGVDSSGRYYIDIISFHCYAFNGSQSRSAMITSLMSNGNMDANLGYLNSRISACNLSHGRTGSAALKTAITEANVNWQNSTTDNLNGTGVNSFIGGQFIAEMFGIGLKNNVDFVNMWSVVEGNNTALNIGYIDAVTGIKKPSYHHFQMMSQNFSGSFITSTSTQTNVKVFSSQNSSVTTVMILNEDLTNNFNCTVRLNTAAVTGTNALKINVNSNIAQEYNDVINNQSTVIFQFNAQGALVKKIVYGLASHATLNLAPTITTYTTQGIVAIAAPVNNTPSNNLSRCTGKTATLTATSGTNTITWYSTSTSTAVLSTGSVLITPSLSVSGSSMTFVYYAQANNSSTVSARTPVTVTIHPRPVITVNSAAICAGNSVTLTPSGANAYTISGGSFIVTPTSNTTYYVSGTNTLGCTSTISAAANITVNALPIVSVNHPTICAGGNATIIPSGALTYTINGGSFVVSPGASTNYSITGTNSLGCTTSSNAISAVAVNSLPVVTLNNATICAGESVTLTPSGAASYSISGGSFVVTPTANTTYSVRGTNVFGCSSASDVVATITVNPLPVIAALNHTLCAGSSATIIPSGANSYSISGGSFVVTPSVNTTYNISGTSHAGCSSSQSATVSVAVVSPPVISVNSAAVCAGKSVTLTPIGATTYSISGGSFVVTPTANASYSVSGTNANGCTSSVMAVANVTVKPLPSIAVNSGTICAGSSLTLNPSGANSYTISGGTFVVAPTVNTSYYIAGTNSLGCTSTLTAVANVTVFARPVVSVNGGSICAGSSFNLIPSGASSYNYSGGSALVSPIINTTYSVTGVSSAGCVSSNTSVATVTVVNRPVIAINSGTVCSGGLYNLQPTGANSYSFSSGTSSVYPSSSTTYSVWGNNAGCLSATPATAVVTVFQRPVISANSGSICAGSSFTITPGGASNYTVLNAGMIVSPSISTSYQVQGVNAAGCTAASPAIVNVTVQALPVITVNSGSVCKGTSFTITPSGATSYTYSCGAPVVFPAASAAYTVSGAINGCKSKAVSYVTVLSGRQAKNCPTSNFLTTTAVPNPSTAKIISPAGGSTFESPAVAQNNEAVEKTESADSLSTSINEIENKITFSIYPNPNNGEFNIDVQEDAQYQILNLAGQTVFQGELRSGKTTINISNLQTAIYIVKIIRGDHLQYSRIIKQ